MNTILQIKILNILTYRISTGHAVSNVILYMINLNVAQVIFQKFNQTSCSLVQSSMLNTWCLDKNFCCTSKQYTGIISIRVLIRPIFTHLDTSKFKLVV